MHGPVYADYILARKIMFDCIASPYNFMTEHVVMLNASADQKRTRRERMAELLEFANDTFLNDADLAQQHALNINIDGLYSERYWVRTHLLHRQFALIYYEMCSI